MLRINTVSLYLAGVLAFGLVSCAKQEDKAKKDEYRAPSPRIIRSGQSFDVSAWDRTSQRSLDFYDAIDVRKSGSSRVSITSNCNRGDKDYSYELNTNETQTIEFYKVLHRDLLTEDLFKLPASCSFKIALTNDIGSKHIYPVAQSQVRNDQPSNVRFERDGQLLVEPRNRFVIGKHAGVIYRQAAGSHAQLLCQDATDAIRGFSEVGRLEDFNLGNLTVKEKRLPDILQLNPIQRCRILFTQGGADQAISSLFEIQFPRSPLVLRPQSQVHRNGDMGSPEMLADPAKVMLRGQPLELATFVLENKMGIVRTVRMPKQNVVVQVSTLTHNGGEILTIARPFVTIVPKGHVEDKGDHWLLHVHEKGLFELSVMFKADRPIHCGGMREAPMVHFMVLDFPQLTVQEINEGGEVIATISADLGPRVYIGTNERLFGPRLVRTVGGICGW